MIIPEPLLFAIIAVALTICSLAPIVLLVLFFRDWRKGRLW